jgi:uroporphyrinogen-III synthase
MQSIQWQMVKRENVFNLEVYATLKHSIEISPDFEIIVFTSPSNVEAFFEKNKLHPHQKAIAMGESTGKALEKLKHKKYTMPPTFDDLGLVQAILAVSN